MRAIAGKATDEISTFLEDAAVQRGGNMAALIRKTLIDMFREAELRSLAARLYADQEGPEFAQAIPGHKSACMTAQYRDMCGAEWTEVKFAG
jgi:hypothetical protein